MIKLISFGYKFGEAEADRVIDCRPLRNPHSDPKLKPLTGKDRAVQDFVIADRRTPDLIRRVLSRAADGETIAFGCFGGRHRSVSLVELVAEALKAGGHTVRIQHRELRENRVA